MHSHYTCIRVMGNLCAIYDLYIKNFVKGSLKTIVYNFIKNRLPLEAVSSVFQFLSRSLLYFFSIASVSDTDSQICSKLLFSTLEFYLKKGSSGVLYLKLYFFANVNMAMR